MPKTSEIKEIQDACAALSLQNQKCAYEVACALKFAEEKPVAANGREGRPIRRRWGPEYEGRNNE